MDIRVINLKRRPDRWERFVQAAKAIDLPDYRRFEAVDGHTLELAYCLNPVTAGIWTRCDGRTSTVELMHLLPTFGVPAEPAAIDSILQQLAQANLLADAPSDPAVSRRELFSRLGVSAAMVIGGVSLMVIPSPADAASGGSTGPTGPCPDTGPTGSC